MTAETGADPAAGRPSAHLGWPITVLAAGQTLIWACLYYSYPALLVHWEADLGWARTTLSAGITLAILASAAGAPLAGRLIDRGQGAALLGGSAVLGGAAFASLALATAPWQFHAASLAVGLAFAGCLYEPCFALVTRARGAAAAGAIIRITLIAGFAGTLSFPAMHMLATALDWRGAVMAAGTFAALAVAPLLWLGARALEREAPPPPQPVRPRGAPPARAFLRTARFWCLALGFACVAAVHGALLHHLLPLLDERGIEADTAVLLAAGIGPMQVAGRLALSASQGRAPMAAVATLSFAAMGSAVVVLWAAGSSLAALGLFVLCFGAAYGVTSIVRPIIARDTLGDAAFGAKSGALAVPFLLAGAAAPYAGAALWRLGGYDAMLAVLLALEAAAFVLYLAARAAPAR
ncbi:MAG: MFS transporter [Pseudomonadota bacterium]